MNRIVIGFAPTRRSIFSAPDAVKYADLTREKLRSMGVEFVDIDDISQDGLLHDDGDRIRIAEKFRERKVDGLFFPHGNFGTEYEVARLAKELNVSQAPVREAMLNNYIVNLLTELLVGRELASSGAPSAGIIEDSVAYINEHLSRELSLEEIREIRAKTPPELEIEVFAHGAMCVSYSGRCLLSNYMTGRDSNRGACAQPCRYQYYLMEEKRPGEYFPVFEDGAGTYIMNSRDMCMIDHLDDLMDLDSLKIEGRAKSAYYAAIVTGAYRHVLDDVAAGRTPDPVWREEVERVSHRRYATGFYYGPPGQYTQSARYIREWQVVALVTSCGPDGWAELSLRNKFRVGDTLELVGPDVKPVAFQVQEMEDGDGMPLIEPKTPQMLLRMRLPQAAPAWSILRIARDLSATS